MALSPHSKTAEGATYPIPTCQRCLSPEVPNDPIIAAFQRKVRVSRLDLFEKESSVRTSTLSGFGTLVGIVGFIYPWLTVLCNWYDRGLLINTELATAMFEDTLILMLMWMKQALWSYSAYVIVRLHVRGWCGRVMVRMVQLVCEGGLFGYSVAACLYRGWPIIPSSFVLMASAILAMKMHSFVDANLSQATLLQNSVTTSPPSPSNTLTPLTDSTAPSPTNSTSLNNHPPSNAHSSITTLTRRSNAKTHNKTFHGWQSKKNKVKQEGNSAHSAFRLRQVKQRLVERERKPHPHPDCEWGPTSHYPHNVTLTNYTYFLFAPVLVYEPYYLRGKGFRFSYLILKSISLTTAMLILYLVISETVLPITMASVHLSGAEYLARLIFPYMAVDLLVFYILFECICNLFAEVTNFGDREFYLDFWNSSDFENFSRKWNRPVHQFLLRHVYHASRNRFKVSKFSASVFTFIVSAICHEAVLAACFRFIRLYMLFMMLVQIPLILFGARYLKGTLAGNVFFWIAMILGIPLISLLYGREWAFMELQRQAFGAGGDWGVGIQERSQSEWSGAGMMRGVVNESSMSGIGATSSDTVYPPLRWF
eukprot:GHVN01106521.1.p1 GENE.GHVN01106521.1~~GHVN01106521.1.p1  ORF type:complete len:594 (+),score=78.36 GHVN01106521.1:323-2104(+)